jgi:hypothetical protein
MATPSVPNGERLGKGDLVPVESASRPNLVHYVSYEKNLCSCEARSFGNRCDHPAQARPYRIEFCRTREGYPEFRIVHRSGRIEGARPSFGDALLDVEELEAGMFGGAA